MPATLPPPANPPAPWNPFPALHYSGRIGPVIGAVVAALLAVLGGFGGLRVAAAAPASEAPAWLSPSAVAAAPDGRTVFVACATSGELRVVDLAERRVTRTVALGAAPSGLALAPDGTRLYVTAGGAAGEVLEVEPGTGAVVGRIPVGHTPMAPVVSADGRTLWVCDRFHDAVGVVDLGSRREVRRIPVSREPVAAALTRDGRHLLVANLLHRGRADADDVAAVVSVIDVAEGRVVKELRLPNGSGVLNDVQVSPDGRYAVVSHILARYPLPTTQLERGWMNTNAGTLIDLARLEVLNTVLLDSVDSGAAHPWGVAWSADGRTLCVAHAGTHEVSLVDFPALLAKLARVPERAGQGPDPDPAGATRERADVPNDLSFLVGLRQRVRLADGDRGPRAVAVSGNRLVTANHFSDTLGLVELPSPAGAAPSGPAAPVTAGSLALGPAPRPTVARRGEDWFHDATLSFQGWQSCATCHPGEARVDALNWDLLNDDLGNPKNNKSLLLSHRTPPVMSLGVRDTAETAVRAGIRHILFTVQPEEVAVAMDEYLKGLQPVPSPLLRKGRLSPVARRGARVFARADVGCADCHPAELFTNLNRYDVGTRGERDAEGAEFDTPTLVEVWRTAPYLHDGSVVDLRELFTTRNRDDRHGRTSHLSARELDALVAYVLSL